MQVRYPLDNYLWELGARTIQRITEWALWDPLNKINIAGLSKY